MTPDTVDRSFDNRHVEPVSVALVSQPLLFRSKAFQLPHINYFLYFLSNTLWFYREEERGRRGEEIGTGREV